MKAAVERAAAEYAAEAAKFQPSKEAGQEAGAESKKQKKKRNKHKKAAQDSSGPAAEQKVKYSHTHRRCSDAQTLLRHTQTHCSDTQTDTQALLRHTHTHTPTHCSDRPQESLFFQLCWFTQPWSHNMSIWSCIRLSFTQQAV